MCMCVCVAFSVISIVDAGIGHLRLSLLTRERREANQDASRVCDGPSSHLWRPAFSAMPQMRSVTSSIAIDMTSTGGIPYVGLDLLQEQTRVKALRKGFVFNLMVAGRSGLGKSTLVDTLFKSQVSRRKHDTPQVIPPTTEIHSTTCFLEERGVKLSLTITDTPGFGDQVNNENCWEPLVSYINEQYSKYLGEEQKIDRPFSIPDTRVHCCLYFIQPSGHDLSSLDIEVLKRLCNIVNIVPVIAKADTLTVEERKSFKERIRADIIDHEVRVYPTKEFEEDEDFSENSKLREMIPFAVVGSSAYHEVQGRKILGRKSNWGVVEVENKEHNDFSILRDMIIRTHMTDLVEVTATRHYGEFRKEWLSCPDKQAFSKGSEE